MKTEQEIREKVMADLSKKRIHHMLFSVMVVGDNGMPVLMSHSISGPLPQSPEDIDSMIQYIMDSHDDVPVGTQCIPVGLIDLGPVPEQEYNDYVERMVRSAIAHESGECGCNDDHDHARPVVH